MQKFFLRRMFFTKIILYLYRRRESVADILRKRLALFHPLNLDNSTSDWDRQKRSSLDGLYTNVYILSGCESFFYIHHSGSPEPSGEYSVIGSHFLVCRKHTIKNLS